MWWNIVLPLIYHLNLSGLNLMSDRSSDASMSSRTTLLNKQSTILLSMYIFLEMTVSSR